MKRLKWVGIAPQADRRHGPPPTEGVPDFPQNYNLNRDTGFQPVLAAFDCQLRYLQALMHHARAGGPCHDKITGRICVFDDPRKSGQAADGKTRDYSLTSKFTTRLTVKPINAP